MQGAVFYIGKGKKNRATQRRQRSKLWEECAKNGYVVEIIKENMTEKQSLAEEMLFIGILNPKANLTWGGQGTSGFKHNPETVKKRNLLMKKRWEDPEFRDKVKKAIAASHKRPEVVEKLNKARATYKEKLKMGLIKRHVPTEKDFKRNSQKMYKYNEDIKLGKRKDHRLGKKTSQETIEKIRAAQSGASGFWFGKTTAFAKKVINIDTNEVFDSIARAAKRYDIPCTRLYRHLAKNTKAPINGIRIKYV